MSSASQRIHLQPAYVLHHRPYRDTSRIVELFTRDYGRLTVFARGARSVKRGVALTSLLQPFHRVLVSYAGRGEAGHLSGAEFDGGYLAMPSARALSGFYLNELLLRLFERHDAHADVFHLYDATIAGLKAPDQNEHRLLRLFEKRLLEMLGYGLSLDSEASIGAPVEQDAVYRYLPERGVTRIAGVDEGELIFSGAALLSLSREALDDPSHRVDARRLLRAALDRCLAGRELNSRLVLREIRAGTTVTRKRIADSG